MRSILYFSAAFVGLGVVLSGCADLLGIEPWKDPPAGELHPTDAKDASAGGSACNDQVQNGDETSVDCGGPQCPPCNFERGCKSDADCVSLYCSETREICTELGGRASCMDPDPDNASCADCILNGSETDIDCGGDACPACRSGKQCGTDADCISGACAGGVCAGGASGKSCYSNEDCASGACGFGNCVTGLCCQ